MMCRKSAMILFLAISTITSGQYTKEFKRIFFDAEYLYISGFYDDALNRYKNLLRLDPGNDNINFRCGACCLRIQGMELEAIPYLEEASKNVSHSYDPGSEKEIAAPVMTYFMLGWAYHLKNDISKAIENYMLYVDNGEGEDPVQVEYAGLQLDACIRAKELAGKPPKFLFASVLDQFDTELPTSSNPVVSGAGDILIFQVDFPSDKKIMMTTRDGDQWSEPREINSEIGMVGETYPTSLSYDGKDLYIVHEYYSHSDIFVSRFMDGYWTEAEPLGKNINKRTSETHASISKDGTRLYFTSDRRGGEGSFDIYVSEMVPGKGWGPAENIGSTINTPYEELTPFISANDSILFFSSQGHATVGGHDVFYSERDKNGNWTEPKNLGYPVSTTSDNLFFNPGWDEQEGYYAVRKGQDPSSNTINMVIELDPGMQALLLETDQISTMPTGFPQECYPPIKVLSGILTLPGMTGKVEGGKVEPESIDEQYIREVVAEKGDSAVPVLTELVSEIKTAKEQSADDEPLKVEGILIKEAPATGIKTSEGEVRSTDTGGETRTGSSDGQKETDLTNVQETAENYVVQGQENRRREIPGYKPAGSRTGATSGEALILSLAIPFEFNDYKLNMTARLQAEKLWILMYEYPEITIELTGRADAVGNDNYNLTLSYKRAETVAKFLTVRDINSKRIRITGKGESDPLAINRYPDGKDAPLGRFINRHVIVTIHGLNHVPEKYIGLYVPEDLKLSEVENVNIEDLPGTSYTIQVLACKNPVRGSYFRNLDSVFEFSDTDGLHKYGAGKYQTYQEARRALIVVRRKGYPDAFVQKINGNGQ